MSIKSAAPACRRVDATGRDRNVSRFARVAGGRRPIRRTGTVIATLALALATPVITSANTSPALATWADRAPIGRLDTAAVVPGGLHVTGWDFDPDQNKTALRTYATVDHAWVRSVAASVYRKDVARAHRNAGPRHGFDWTVPVPEGNHLVCVSARNVGRGHNILLGCRRMTFDYGPHGALDALTTTPGTLHVSGWAVDADSLSAPVTVSVAVDGVGQDVVASARRARGSAGGRHGFALAVPTAQGRHTVCVTAHNIGYGSDNRLGCRTVTVNDSPRAAITAITQVGGTLKVSGWAFDPDQPAATVATTVTVDGRSSTRPARDRNADIIRLYPQAGARHGFHQTLTVTEGRHTICVRVANIGFGSDTVLRCRTATVLFTPTAALDSLTATATGAHLTGWATDPDTAAALTVRFTVDGTAAGAVVADLGDATHPGHAFAADLAMRSGRHTVCAVAVNAGAGRANSARSCQVIGLTLAPIGQFENLVRDADGTDLDISGWALDPDTSTPIRVGVTVDGTARADVRAAALRPDVAVAHPGYGSAHGLRARLTATTGEHTVCVTARNVSGGADVALGCKVVNAVHPIAPSAPQAVTASGSYSAAIVNWQAPASDGGAPWTSYVVTASPGGRTATVDGSTRQATVTGLAAKTSYSFTVQAVNVAGASAPAVSNTVRTLAGPPPQTTVAPISTSRYIRNVRGSSAAELATMYAEGAADAVANPAGHRYLMLLDIGGQDDYDRGVVLSTTVRFVAYGDLARDVMAYVDGYHSAQRAGAPATIAIGTNNDMNVSASTGRSWATRVVNPVLAHAAGYAGLKIAGANDMEPGFRATYASTKNWLSGYLAATSAQFVFNGSADGCSSAFVSAQCNNGWTMAGLYYLAGGAAPTRIVNLPQVYNTTMAGQWKYISLTGVVQGQPRINFGGPLTEWTACAQTNSCGSMTGNSAWNVLWQNLQSDARLRIASLPYSTDLRVDQ